MNQSTETVQAYQKLCTEFYDITKPWAGPKEIQFYEEVLSRTSGPSLEAMCGSGRLLIPLLKRGHQIEGVDNSDEMLKSCVERGAESNLKITLYHESLLSLMLEKPYGLIFIAAGSFQLFPDRSEALSVLRSLYQNLAPGGTLLIDTFIPWGMIRENIEDDVLSYDKRNITTTKCVTTSDQSTITMTAETVIDQKRQLEICHSRYEKWSNKKLVAFEEETLSIRWYHRYEMELFLEIAGFTVKRVWDVSNELDPQATIYEAHKE